MPLSDLIAAAALLVSIAVYFQTRMSLREISDKTARENELLRHQIDEARNQKIAEKRASVSARIYKISSSNWRVKVFNRGPAPAHNVRLILDDQNEIIQVGLISEKFPMGQMEAGQSVEFPARVYIGTPSKEKLTINWVDQDGGEQSHCVELTI